MYKYEIQFKKPNSPEWHNLTRWARPFTDGTTLDETLDEGKINLVCTERSRALPPFTKIRITISESNPDGTYEKVGEINRVVGTVHGVKRRFVKPYLFNWDIQTLEETKQLEREICRSMTSTNYLRKDYGNGKFELEMPNFYWLSEVVKDFELTPTQLTPDLYGPISSKELPYEIQVPIYRLFYKIPNRPAGHYMNGYIGVISPNGDKQEFGIYGLQPTDPTPDIKYQLTESGTYTFYIDYVYSAGRAWRAETKIGVFANITPRKDPTITSVCERLLSAGITRREGVEQQKYTLDPVFAEKYKDVPAPEFSFTRQTLFEALLTVGGYIHAIPRLNGNVVTFDELGGDDEIDMTKFPKQVYCDKTITINDFTSALDSPAQNLLNTQDRVGGAITELGNDYITVRAEQGEVIISADTAIIRTSLPINQIVKLECGFIDGRSEPVGDMTAYVYEAAEYDVLSSFWDSAYPYSKGYALRYAQGDNKITGLQTKLQYPTNIESDLANPAIINIIRALTGVKIASTDMKNLAFRVTYVPIVTSRVTQRKPYGSPDGANNGAGWDNTLFYNQGGNVVESSFYGDKMKGAIARLGNEVEQRTYDFYHYSQLPKCGQKLDGMYIARVDAEYDITRIRATLTLTKDFNMLSQYVGLNSNYRLYDISEKQSVESFINYSENIYVGDAESLLGKTPMFWGIDSIVKTLNHTGGNRIHIAKIDAKDRDGNAIGKPVLLPVMAFGFGNSLAFTCSMHDNYGAGFQNSAEFEVDSKYKGVQRLVPYGDGLGELETMSVEMHVTGWNPTAADQQPGGRANLYPAYVDGLPASNRAPIRTGNNDLIIQKDSREQLGFAYQAHYVANRETIVLGPSLTYSNVLVAEPKSTKFNLYFFDRELNMLDKVIDLSNAFNAGTNYTATAALNFTAQISGIVNTQDKTFKSWGIVEVADDNATQGTLFIGENVELASGATAPAVNFMVKANK